MNRLEHLGLMATYNQWMNEKVYASARQLPEDAVHREAGAFFGSIFGTLNHIAVGDTLWLKRFAQHLGSFTSLQAMQGIAAPERLDAELFPTLEALAQYRDVLDRTIIAFAAELQETHLDEPFAYVSTKGMAARQNLFGVLTHFFNHQTHHRGQATTLLSQQGLDVGATDLLLLVPRLAE